jgi:predicted XRE-type DNA-binding protein
MAKRSEVVEYTQDDLRRFEMYLIKGTGCWIFTGGQRGNNNYGGFTLHRKNIAAHRFAYIVYVGQIPPDLLVLHKCNIPLCCNPSHLYLGTAQNNANDRDSQNRLLHNSKEQHPMHKLTQEEVNQIKLLCAAAIPQRQIAKQFNVTQAAISAINRGRNWTSER